MKIGFVGLGKMGGNMVERLLKNGHEVVIFDMSDELIKKYVQKGAISSSSLEDMVSKLPERKVVWLMVPAGKPVDLSIETLKSLMSANDIVIDGGNSFWKDTLKRKDNLLEKQIHFIDCGTSGGVWGLDNGYCLMYGGNKEACEYTQSLYSDLTEEGGALYCGESGSGHFTKMVHNGIEYGMMQSFAEGFELMKESSFDLDLQKISKLWMTGSVVRSWLLELIGNSLTADPKLDKLKDYVEDSGEARWTIESAMDFNVPVNVIAASLFARFQSRQDESFAMKMLAAMRNQFGGHAVKEK